MLPFFNILFYCFYFKYPTPFLKHLEALGKNLFSFPLDNDFIVPDRNGSMANPRNLSMDFTKKLEKYLELKQISFHGLRHTHATMLLKYGENIKVVSARLGHKDITTTLNTYMHVMPDIETNTSTLLDNIFLNRQ